MREVAKLAEGARNLLVDCGGLTPGKRLLIIHENPEFGWYDLAAPMAVAAEARRMATATTVLEVGDPSKGKDALVVRAISAHDVIVFFARIGDQDRFADPAPGKVCVMSYARNAHALASEFGRTRHHAMVALKRAVNGILFTGRKVEIRCPLGTALSGTLTDAARSQGKDVGIRRFPMGVPQPVDASGLSGKVALARYLTPTGSQVYEPASVKLEKPVIAEIESGRISGFSGQDKDVARVRKHHRHVADLFGIDGEVVHSWHAGIHPGCAYPVAASSDPDRWSNTVFCNPRFLHFHTCGDYAPGEICWMVLDPTVIVDGEALWQDGRLRVNDFPQTLRSLDSWPEVTYLFAHPCDQIGL